MGPGSGCAHAIDRIVVTRETDRAERMPAMRRILLPILLMIAGAGCQPQSDRAASSGSRSNSRNRATDSGNLNPERPDLTSLPSDGDIFVQLDVFQLVLPHGRISRNDEFWR